MNWKNKFDTIKVGDKVKLKTYLGFSDWVCHENEIAEVIDIKTHDFDDMGLTYEIEWEDGDISNTGVKNLVKVE